MNLRFTQTLREEQAHTVPHGLERGPDRPLDRQWVVGSSVPTRRRDELEFVPGQERSRGIVGVFGRLPKDGLPELPQIVAPTREEVGTHRAFRTPRWLDGTFRPRQLSRVGLEFLESMDPARIDRREGVNLVQAEPWGSLEERMAHLQRKYLALDMVLRGVAVEADGRYWPKVFAAEARRAHVEGPMRRHARVEEGPLTLEDTLIWVGAFREASWDQVRSLHPPHQVATDHLLQLMIEKQLLEQRVVVLGRGELHTLRLADRGLEFLKAMEGGKDLIRRGFGPRKTGRGIGEYHEQAVGDGLAYFAHEVQESGGRVLGFTLERGLRREYVGAKHFPDFRVEFENSFGGASWDVEVMGHSTNVYRSGPRIQKLNASPTLRGFDPLGRTNGARAKDVRVTR